MAYIVVPSRWQRQPQGPVGIDWSNPLTRGLIFAQRGGDAADLVSNRRPATGVGAPLVGVGQAGVARSYSSASDFYADNRGADAATTLACLVVARVSNFGTWGGLICHTSNLGTTVGAALWQEAYGGLAHYDGSATVRGTTVSPGAVYDGRVHHFGGGVSSSGFAAYFDGAPAGSGASAGAAPGVGYVKVASSRDTALAGGLIFLAALWNRIPSQDEYRALYQNCWQLFRALSRRIYVDLGASTGIPTLSAATVTSITANSATPRVTLTF